MHGENPFERRATMNLAERAALQVTKMHGTNNEFILVEELPPLAGRYSELARRLCDRRDGLGADGLLVVGAPPTCGYINATMRIFNADGSEAEMCGNGIRCVARFLNERTLRRTGGRAADRYVIGTAAGPIRVEILAREPEYRVRVDIGKPVVDARAAEATIDAAGRTWRYRSISLGNPHIVVPVDDLAQLDVARIGAELAAHARFPNGTNVHFSERLDRRRIRVRHYERGVGITQSCGTGAVASAVAAIVAGDVDSPVTVELPGGTLVVEWHEGTSATLIGPAERVFERTISL